MKRQIKLNIKRGLLSKLVLLVALFLGSSNAWAQKSVSGDGYSYGFENNNLAAEGWTSINPNTGSYSTGIAYSSYTSHSGTYYFRFYSNENPPQTLMSPLLQDSESEIIVSFYYRIAYNNNNQTFQVGYTSDTTTPANNMIWKDAVICSVTSYNQCTYTLPAHTRYIAIKCTTTTTSENMGNNYYLCIDDFHVEESNPYKTPTDFICSSITVNSATFSWTAGNEETAWKFAYSTDADFTPNIGTAASITANPYTLTGLTEGTTYYARICADYGGGNYSDWTEKVAFTPSDETEKTINEGSDYGGYAPIYGSYTNSITRTQLIIPSSSLTTIRNRQITKITFYTSSDPTYETLSWGTSTFEVYLKPISSSSFASSTLESWGTKVYNSATVSVSAHKMEIILDTPYNYTEGNLMIGFKQTGTGAYKYAKWIGTTGASNTLLYGYGNNSNNRTSFNPQITFTTRAISTDPVQMDDNGYTTYASPRALDLTALPSGLKAYKAEVSAGEGKVRFTDINQKVAANTGILLAGTAGETYNIPVADSGDPVGDNAFLVNSTGGTFAAEGGYTYFGFKKNSDPITFATFNPSTVAIPTNKAYLKVETSLLPPAEARQLVAVFDDGETTSLRKIRNEELGIKNAVFFNLNGQRVAQPTKGLYIVNGKKVLVP